VSQHVRVPDALPVLFLNSLPPRDTSWMEGFCVSGDPPVSLALRKVWREILLPTTLREVKV
jgi:hypothetical protein